MRCAFSPCRTIPKHNAHCPEKIKIYYQWHPLRGQDLSVRRRVQLPSGEYIFGGFPDGTIGGFPAWMTDPAICAACPTGSPMTSAASLGELRTLLDNGKRDGSTSLDGAFPFRHSL